MFLINILLTFHKSHILDLTCPKEGRLVMGHNVRGKDRANWNPVLINVMTETMSFLLPKSYRIRTHVQQMCEKYISPLEECVCGSI